LQGEKVRAVLQPNREERGKSSTGAWTALSSPDKALCAIKQQECWKKEKKAI
jgi:hypothetical protein